MPQLQLPFFPDGVTHIAPLLGQRAGEVLSNRGMPVFVHDEENIDSFRMIIAQFCVNSATGSLRDEIRTHQGYGCLARDLLAGSARKL